MNESVNRRTRQRRGQRTRAGPAAREALRLPARRSERGRARRDGSARWRNSPELRAERTRLEATIGLVRTTLRRGGELVAASGLGRAAGRGDAGRARAAALVAPGAFGIAAGLRPSRLARRWSGDRAAVASGRGDDASSPCTSQRSRTADAEARRAVQRRLQEGSTTPRNAAHGYVGVDRATPGSWRRRSKRDARRTAENAERPGADPTAGGCDSLKGLELTSAATRSRLGRYDKAQAGDGSSPPSAKSELLGSSLEERDAARREPDDAAGARRRASTAAVGTERGTSAPSSGQRAWPIGPARPGASRTLPARTRARHRAPTPLRGRRSHAELGPGDSFRGAGCGGAAARRRGELRQRRLLLGAGDASRRAQGDAATGLTRTAADELRTERRVRLAEPWATRSRRRRGGVRCRPNAAGEQLRSSGACSTCSTASARPNERPRDMFFRFWGDNPFELARARSALDLRGRRRHGELHARAALPGRRRTCPRRRRCAPRSSSTTSRPTCRRRREGDVRDPAPSSRRAASASRLRRAGCCASSCAARRSTQRRAPAARADLRDRRLGLDEGAEPARARQARAAPPARASSTRATRSRIVAFSERGARRPADDLGREPRARSRSAHLPAAARAAARTPRPACGWATSSRSRSLDAGTRRTASCSSPTASPTSARPIQHAHQRRRRSAPRAGHLPEHGRRRAWTTTTTRCSSSSPTRATACATTSTTPTRRSRALVDGFTGAFEPIARDVKIQVEFDPAQVERYRLLGYENRAVADQDFRNDAVDAGEVGAGHQVIALYEIVRSARRRTSSRSRPCACAASRRTRRGHRGRRDARPATEIERPVTLAKDAARASRPRAAATAARCSWRSSPSSCAAACTPAATRSTSS